MSTKRWGVVILMDMDQYYMHRAIDLADRACGRTWPNPLVGCVVVKAGSVIAEGWHHKAGEAHAERDALLKLPTGAAAGATLYVTLEPCCHQGRTPPCTDLIIAAGISRVVVGSTDPNPLVAGKGIRQLEAAGIDVTVGVAEARCQEQNLFFRHFMLQRRPYIAQKYAMTLDGKIAAVDGSSKWITGEQARQHVQTLRKAYHSILIGSGTALADDPLLTCRIDPQANPIRLICDRRFRLHEDLQLVQTATEVRTILFSDSGSTAADPLKKKRLTEVFGLEIYEQEGGFTVPDLVQKIAGLNIVSVLVEGGSSIHGSFLTAGLTDYVYAYIAPKLVGGELAPGPVGGAGLAPMASALTLTEPILSRFGQDILLAGRPQGTAGQDRSGELTEGN